MNTLLTRLCGGLALCALMAAGAFSPHAAADDQPVTVVSPGQFGRIPKAVPVETVNLPLGDQSAFRLEFAPRGVGQLTHVTGTGDRRKVGRFGSVTLYVENEGHLRSLQEFDLLPTPPQVQPNGSDGLPPRRHFGGDLGLIKVEGDVGLRRVRGGLLLDYGVEVSDRLAHGEVVWAWRLPRERLVGNRIRLDGVLLGKRGGAADGKPHTARTIGLKLRHGGRFVTLVAQREAPAEVRLLPPAEAKRYGVPGDDLLILVDATPAPHELTEEERNEARMLRNFSLYAPTISQPQEYRFAFFLGEESYAGPPVVISGEPFPANAAQYQMLDCDLRVLAGYESPFDESQFTLTADVQRTDLLAEDPADEHETLLGYYTQEFKRRRVRNPLKVDLAGNPIITEKLIPQGEAHWRIRYTPRRTGRHRIRLRLRSPHGETVHTRRLDVRAAEGDERTRFAPFPQVDDRDRRFLVGDDGRPLIPVGLNVAWPNKQGTFNYDEIFSGRNTGCPFGPRGVNVIRLWMSTWWAGIDTKKPDQFDLADAWKIERVLESARARDVLVQLCFDNAHDFARNKRLSPFFSVNGGPARRPDDFFRMDEARAQYRRRLRYLVARYGAYPNLMAWELWNELDLAVDLSEDDGTRARLLTEWVDAMSTSLQELDAYDHLVTVSLSGRRVARALVDAVDVASVHAYIHTPTAGIDIGVPRDAPSFVHLAVAKAQRVAADGLGTPICPVLVDEFGFAPISDPDASVSELNREDPSGIHLHNAIWAGGLSGAAGPPWSWWWDSYILPNELTHHHAAFARFMAGEDPAAGAYRVLRPAAVHRDRTIVRACGLYGRRGALLWLQNDDNVWTVRRQEMTDPALVKDVKLTLRGLEAGFYDLEWWDTYRGQITTTVPQRVTDGTLVLDVPPFRRDIAVKVKKRKK